jgi:hypothetical protein
LGLTDEFSQQCDGYVSRVVDLVRVSWNRFIEVLQGLEAHESGPVIWIIEI